MERISDSQISYDGRSAAVLEESVLNVRTVAACNGQETMIGRYGEALKACRKFALRGYAIAAFFDGLFYFILYFSLAVGFL